MDLTTMLRKLRRSIASFAVVAIIASLSVASAVSAFSDVSESDWYYSNVQDLVDAGVLDGTKDMFHPADNLNRAEAAKIAVLAAGVAEEDLVNPETPSFSDVPKSLWAYKYIETAKSLGYVSGDAGKKTFRPGDNVNRAEYAKMMSLALELEENVVGGPHFSDVSSSAWYYNVVETAYNWSVVSGYEGGIYKPSAAINRAEMSKMTVAAMDPTERVAPTPTPGVDCTKTPAAPECVVAPVAGSDMSVSLASDSPAGTTHASGTSYNNVLKLNVTASSSGDSKLSKLTLTRGGISIDSNIAGIAVFDAAGKRHGNFLTFSENKAVIDFSSDPIVVAKGTTTPVTIKTNLVTGALAGTYQVSVLKAEDVDAAGGKVTGSFPISGSTFQLANGASTVGTVTVDAVLVHNNGANDVTAVNINLGTKDQDIARFRFAAGANEDVKISKLALYNNGNSNDGDVQNIRLVSPDGTILATVAQTKGRDLMFDLSAAPYLITKGNSRDLTVRLDVVSGSTRTARFVIQNDYDVEVTGVSTLSGLLATAAGTVDTAFPMGDSSGATASCTTGNTCINKITINSGTALFAKSNDAPTGNVAAGGTNLTIGKWDITAQGEDMELRTMTYALAYGTVPTGSFKIKVGEQTVYSSSTFGATTVTTAVTLSSYPVIKAGVKQTISFVIDVGSSTASGATYGATLDVTQVKRLSTNDLIDPSVNATAANTLSVATASLASSKNSSFGNTTVVAGLTDAKIGSFNLSASSTEDVTISSVTVGLTNTTAVSNLKLMSGAVQLGNSITSPVASNVFSISGFKILKGATATVDVYLTSTSAATGTQVASLTAVGASGAASSVTITATGLTTTGQTITFSAAGTLTVALDATNTPVARVLHSGMIDETLVAARLTSNNAEDVKITYLQVVNTNGDSNLRDLKLFVGATQQGTTTQLTNGVAAFSGLNLVVPKDSTVTLLVKGSTTTSGIINSTSNVNVGLGYVEATGVSGGATIKPGTTTATTWTAVSTAADTPAALTVASSVGFHMGDVVLAHSNVNGGSGQLGIVTAEPTSTTAVTVATKTAVTTNAAGTLTKIGSGAWTAATAGAAVIAGAAITVTSTKGFAVGDAVIFSNGTITDYGYVSAVGSATSMTINARVADAGAIDIVAKLGYDTLSTASTTGATTSLAGVAQVVASTSGFSTGDVVLVADSANAGSLGIVTAVSSSTAMTVSTTSVVTATSATSLTFIRIGSVNPSSSLVTTAASAGNAVVEGAAVTSTSTSGFGVGDVVMGQFTAGGAILGRVSAVGSATSMTVNANAASANAATRVTRLPSAAAAGNRMMFHDSELTVSANTSFAGGSTAGGSGQTVGMFDLKADGDRNMTVSSVRVKMGGSNFPYAYVNNFDLYNGGSLLASANNVIGTAEADASGANVLAATNTTIILCNAATGAADTSGSTTNDQLNYVGLGGASGAIMKEITAGDTIVFFESTSAYATYKVTSATVGSACTGTGDAGDVTLVVTNGTAVGTVDDDAPTLYNYSVTFNTNSSPALASQVITGGSTLSLTVKADTTAVKTGVTSGSTNFNTKLDGVAGPASDSTNAVTWTYTPSNGSAITNTTVSDSYPVAAPTLVY